MLNEICNYISSYWVFLQHNADCSLRNHRGESALDLACLYGRLDTVRLLLDRKPELVSGSEHKTTPCESYQSLNHKYYLITTVII